MTTTTPSVLSRHCLPVSILLLLIMFSAISCKTSKSIVYFQNMQKDTVINNLVNKDFNLRIRKNDMLFIGVSSADPVNSAIFMAPQAATGSSSTTGAQASGFPVDNQGYIEFPKLGKLKVDGMTRNELRDRLQKDLLLYLKDPVITVRFLNQRITVLGEVTKPGVIMMPSEKMTLLEVLGQSGDMTVFGRRDNILIIRENEGNREFKRVSLENNSLFTSPYYYLQPDDVVYVEPVKARYNTEEKQRTQQLVSYIISGITVALLVLDRIIR